MKLNRNVLGRKLEDAVTHESFTYNLGEENYDLVGIVNHHGTLVNDGHFTFDCLASPYAVSKQAWRCDDDKIPCDLLEEELLADFSGCYITAWERKKKKEEERVTTNITTASSPPCCLPTYVLPPSSSQSPHQSSSSAAVAATPSTEGTTPTAEAAAAAAAATPKRIATRSTTTTTTRAAPRRTITAKDMQMAMSQISSQNLRLETQEQRDYETAIQRSLLDSPRNPEEMVRQAIDFLLDWGLTASQASVTVDVYGNCLPE